MCFVCGTNHDSDHLCPVEADRIDAANDRAMQEDDEEAHDRRVRQMDKMRSYNSRLSDGFFRNNHMLF